MKDSILDGIKAFFNGFSQIMLQENIWTGILFITAILFDSTHMGIAGIAANIIAIATAKLMKFNPEYIQKGFYGFNAALFGIAIVFYFQESFGVWMILILGTIATTFIMNYALTRNLPVFTFPFVLITWISLLALSIPELASKTIPENFVEIEKLDDFLIEGHAFGQVIFQGGLITGFIFFIGIFINKPIAALYGFVAVIISIYISNLSAVTQQQINSGAVSFNAVLCGIALSGPRVRDGIYVSIAVIIATRFDLILIDYGWTTLTFPFVFAMWMMVPLQKLEARLIPQVQRIREYL